MYYYGLKHIFFAFLQIKSNKINAICKKNGYGNRTICSKKLLNELHQRELRNFKSSYEDQTSEYSSSEKQINFFNDATNPDCISDSQDKKNLNGNDDEFSTENDNENHLSINEDSFFRFPITSCSNLEEKNIFDNKHPFGSNFRVSPKEKYADAFRYKGNNVNVNPYYPLALPSVTYIHTHTMAYSTATLTTTNFLTVRSVVTETVGSMTVIPPAVTFTTTEFLTHISETMTLFSLYSDTVTSTVTDTLTLIPGTVIIVQTETETITSIQNNASSLSSSLNSSAFIETNASSNYTALPASTIFDTVTVTLTNIASSFTNTVPYSTLTSTMTITSFNPNETVTITQIPVTNIITSTVTESRTPITFTEIQTVSDQPPVATVTSVSTQIITEIKTIAESTITVTTTVSS